MRSAQGQIISQIADSLTAVGHRPSASLSVQDEALFRAFQSNLLSLISHELRTPLTGILNALSVLEEGTVVGNLTPADWVKMARENAFKLRRALTALLDLAAIESGTFHVRLREVDLARLIQTRIPALEVSLKDRELSIQCEMIQKEMQFPLLADPQKLGRAIDLCFEVLISRAVQKSKTLVRIASNRIEFEFELTAGTEQNWELAWSQSLIGFQGGVTSPYSAFAGVMQTEQAFLTRVEEGLGSEFLLIHQITQLHRGSLTATRNGKQVKMCLELPELASEEGLRAVLSSRVYSISNELGSVALILIQVPQSVSVEELRKSINSILFRASDAIYCLGKKNQLAIVLDDCKVDDAPRLMKRMLASLDSSWVSQIRFGVAQCPSDGIDPGILFDLALSRLK